MFDEEIEYNLTKMGKAWYIVSLYNKYVRRSNELPLRNTSGFNARVNRLPQTLEDDIKYIKELELHTKFSKLHTNSLGYSVADLRGALDRVERVLGL